MITITLRPYQISLASMCATMRRVRHIANGWKNHAHGLTEDSEALWDIDNYGCMGECATALYLNLFWNGGTPNKDEPDVGGLVDVRSIWKRPNDRLTLHKGDKDERPIVLARVRLPDVDLIGWMIARDGKKDEWWQNPTGKNGRDAYFVPRSFPPLLPMEQLRERVAREAAA